MRIRISERHGWQGEAQETGQEGNIFDRATPLPERDLTWHRTQAAGLDRTRLQRALNRRLNRGDFRAATVYLARLQNLDPTAERALQLGQLHMRCRSYRTGVQFLQQAAAQWPDDLSLLRARAELAMLAQDFVLAGTLWRDLLARQTPAGPYPVLRALACLRQTGQSAQAREIALHHAEILRRSMSRTGVQMLRNGRDTMGKLPRGLYLVSGNNGTGKSTLGHMLQAMGYPVIDADTQIASFCLRNRFSDIRYELQRLNPQAESDIVWAWPELRVTEQFAAARHRREAVFVIGGFGRTVSPFCDRFRQIFHLSAPDHVIAARLARRASIGHRPGSKGYAAALKRNARHQQPEYAATVLCSDRPVSAICAELLSQCRSHPQEVPGGSVPAFGGGDGSDFQPSPPYLGLEGRSPEWTIGKPFINN